METSLHQQLKIHYAGSDANTEVAFGRYRIDAVRGDELIEIQCASLSAISRKINALLKRHRVRVVKPVIVRTRIAKKARANGKVQSRRMSPKRGDVLDLFDDLIYFTNVFPHENLCLEVALVHVEQTRIPAKNRRRRWRQDYRVTDVSLEQIESTLELQHCENLLTLANVDTNVDCFTTKELAIWTNRPRWFAQKIAYVLKHTGSIKQVARKRNGIIYQAA
ncbi:MAG: hypothetical protein AAF802_21340 [Planctomycetota bacterium]